MDFYEKLREQEKAQTLSRLQAKRELLDQMAYVQQIQLAALNAEMKVLDEQIRQLEVLNGE